MIILEIEARALLLYILWYYCGACGLCIVLHGINTVTLATTAPYLQIKYEIFYIAVRIRAVNITIVLKGAL
jgi:hypothetical protein